MDKKELQRRAEDRTIKMFCDRGVDVSREYFKKVKMWKIITGGLMIPGWIAVAQLLGTKAGFYFGVTLTVSFIWLTGMLYEFEGAVELAKKLIELEEEEKLKNGTTDGELNDNS